jgi:hypothetical protein
MKYDKIQKAYEETLIGKEFVYLSKYGSTVFGKVSGILIVEQYAMDDESNRKWKVAIGKKTGNIKLEEKDYNPIEVEKEWNGSFLEINILSENNNYYTLGKDKIYFIS